VLSDTGVWVCGTFSISEEVVPFPKKKERPSEVSINIMAAAVVTLCKKDVAPLLPKTVWLDPPKAAPIPAPLPL
jgi:hypothetical protein